MIADEIRALIGTGGLEELIRAYGGRRIYVPVSVNERHPLALRLGWRGAVALSQAFGGDFLEIPSARRLSLNERNRRIRAEHSAGMSQQALADSYRLTVRQIRNILMERDDA